MSAKAKTETICAAATAAGRGGVGVVRVSGDAVPELISQWLGRSLPPRTATLCDFRDQQGELIDRGLAIYFPAPHSYTGEAILELQGHGNPVILEALVQRLRQFTIRRALPGEFTQRAFLNDKLDLAQAEAVADLINAASLQAVRAAQRSLDGVFSQAVYELVDALVELRVYIEAALDFPDEEIDFLASGQVLQRLDSLRGELDELLTQAERGRVLNDGLRIAIVGRPNAGKSSLLNALCGNDRAIVTAVAGTTRDVISERLQIDGLPVELLDTAGLRQTEDLVEAEGVRRTQRELDRADLVLWVVDASDAQQAEESPPQTSARVIKVHNKIDLCADRDAVTENASALAVSAKYEQGIEQLRQAIVRSAGLGDSQHNDFTARARHLEILRQAQDHLDLARDQLTQYEAPELLAEELRMASDRLGEITGRISSDELLGRIFSSFCIGK
ncbi:MAG: tRNA uridine-5-carboxymethylaminomethyl(34) synthesis GTPase MnmE [Wenzhouxiangellaceae bacterium]